MLQGTSAESHAPAEEKQRSLALKDFSLHGLLGEGEFGRVMMATQKDTQQVCSSDAAIKCCLCRSKMLLE